jgi:GR25 family glycosyltransferase involved in LPS biosynthesis
MVAKKKAIKTFAPLLFFLVFAAIIMAVYVWISRLPVTIVDTHVINMDKSMDRWEEIQQKAREARLPVKRWRAVDGSLIKEDDARQYNVSKLITRHTTEKKQPGVIGCFLSHKTLLKHLGDQWNMPWHAHFILEDDAYIPTDFWKQWNEFSRELPGDWDIVQIGVTYPNLKRVPGHVRLHTHSESRGNVGAFAYLVRHGSLTKINDHLRYMYDPIDVMLRNKQNEWKIYFAWPEICPHDDHGKSTIVTEASSK